MRFKTRLAYLETASIIAQMLVSDLRQSRRLLTADAYAIGLADLARALQAVK